MRHLTTILLLLVSTHSFCQSRKQLDSLTIVLEKILVDDQKYRLEWDSVESKYGFNSPEFMEIAKKTDFQDSINIVSVKKILDEYGWLSTEQTSKDANSALFLVIQHAPVRIQLKYLPMMKKAVADKKARASDLALLVDRTNMFQGKLQIYGSQLNYDPKGNLHIYPILDESNLNSRRKSVGLPSMQEYLKLFSQQLTYSPPKTDRYKNKIVLKGAVSDDKENQPLANVSIHLGNNLLIGKSDSSGFFQVVIDPKYRNWAIIFRKQNFQSSALLLDDNAKDVIEINPILKRK